MSTFRWPRLFVIVSCLSTLLFTVSPAASSPEAPPRLPAAGPGAVHLDSNYRWDVRVAASHAIVDPFSNPMTHHSHSFVLDGLGRPRIVYGYDRLYYAYNNGGGWQIEVVDDFMGGVTSASLALDGGGAPAVSYCRDGQLMIARRSAGTWYRSSLYNGCEATSIAFASNGLVRIAYSTGDQLRFASAGLNWSHQWLLNAGSGYYISYVNLIIDDADTIHIGYRLDASLGGDRIMYLHSTTDVWPWSAPLLVVEGIDNHFFGMAVNVEHQACFAYVWIPDYPSPGELIFARLMNTGLDFDVYKVRDLYLDGDGLTAESIDTLDMILMDGVNPLIAYYHQTYRGLGQHYYLGYSTLDIFGQNPSESYDVTETYMTSPYVNLAQGGNATKMAGLDGAGLFMFDPSPDSIGQWIDISKYYLGQTSLALDSQNRAHVSFYDWGTADLMYAAENSSGGYDIEAADTAENVGKYNSLAIGPEGFANIAYYDAANGDLKLTYNGPGGWAPPILVDGAGADVGQYVSMKIDADGWWHMTYYDATNKDLKYAYKDISGWHISTLESAGDVGLYSSLALDGGGQPHIAYYDATNGALKYTFYDVTWHPLVLDNGANGKAGIGGISLAALPNGYGVAYVVQGTTANPLKYKRSICFLGNCLWQDAETVAENVDLSHLTDADDAINGVSLVVDAAGTPYIAYYTGVLRVAARRAGAWTNERPDPQFVGEGRHSSLAIDRRGKPHVSYQYGVYFSIRVAQLKDLVYLPVLKK